MAPVREIVKWTHTRAWIPRRLESGGLVWLTKIHIKTKYVFHSEFNITYVYNDEEYLMGKLSGEI